VLVPAQFQGDQDSGTLRRFTQLEFEVYYTDTVSADFSSPVVWAVESKEYENEADFWVTTEDTSGIQRVVMAYTQDGVIWKIQDLAPDPSEERLWSTHMAGLSDQFVYFIQVVDGAGNVKVTSNKGLLFEPIEINVYLPLTLSIP
jgi:hypothetical protein